jgi:hypothetical protein
MNLKDWDLQELSLEMFGVLSNSVKIVRAFKFWYWIGMQNDRDGYSPGTEAVKDFFRPLYKLVDYTGKVETKTFLRMKERKC